MNKKIEIVLVGIKSGKAVKSKIIPVKILCSFWSGRRYLCAYIPTAKRFSSYRIDTIKSVVTLEIVDDYKEIQDSLSRNLDRLWGVSFDGDIRNDSGFKMVLHIDEKHEKHIISRINKEGRGGVLERIGENTFKFSIDIFDTNEAMPWIKTFIGRIISFEANDWLKKKLNTDITRMAEMYGIGEIK
jgi:hypothetical protein